MAKKKEAFNIDEFIGNPNFMDYVLMVKEDGQYIMAEAPFCTNIKKGEAITVGDETGTVQGTVIASVSMDKTSEEFDFLIKASVFELPLPKVINRIKCEVVEWGK